MSAPRLLVAVVILVTYLVAGVLYAVVTPNWQAPDEPAHYNYIRFLATEAGFPELVAGCYDQTYLNELTSRRFPPGLSIDDICYEFHQPPLYYLLATPIFILSDGSLVALRLFSVVLGGGVVILAFLIGQTISPDRPAIAYGTMAFVAFVPMHVAILSSVNNDALAELLLASLLLLLSRRLLLVDAPSTRSDIWLGVLLGLGLVTKTTVYIAIPLVAVALWLAEHTQKRENKRSGLPAVANPGHERGFGSPFGAILNLLRIDWSAMLKHAAIIYGLALIIAMPWYVRNTALYGDFDVLGLKRHDEIVVGQLRTADVLAQIGGTTYVNNFVTTTFHSFWGQFGWMAVPMDSRTYLLLALLTLIALGGLVAFLVTGVSSRLSSAQRDALSLMAVTIVLMALAYGWYNLTFVQFQGRYLFPSLIPLGLFFSLGLNEALDRRWSWWLAGGLALALMWVVVTSGPNGGLDKWAVLIIGLALGLAAVRALVARRYWSMLTSWLLAACYIGLGLLTLVSPFWFVLPYL